MKQRNPNLVNKMDEFWKSFQSMRDVAKGYSISASINFIKKFQLVTFELLKTNNAKIDKKREKGLNEFFRHLDMVAI